MIEHLIANNGSFTGSPDFASMPNIILLIYIIHLNFAFRQINQMRNHTRIVGL